MTGRTRDSGRIRTSKQRKANEQSHAGTVGRLRVPVISLGTDPGQEWGSWVQKPTLTCAHLAEDSGAAYRAIGTAENQRTAGIRDGAEGRRRIAHGQAAETGDQVSIAGRDEAHRRSPRSGHSIPGRHWSGGFATARCSSLRTFMKHGAPGQARWTLRSTRITPHREAVVRSAGAGPGLESGNFDCNGPEAVKPIAFAMEEFA